MKTPRITVDMLDARLASPACLKRFKAIFPNGAPLTIKSARQAMAAGLNLDWAVRVFATPDGLNHYQSLVWVARARYNTLLGCDGDAVPIICRRASKAINTRWAEYIAVAAPVAVRVLREGLTREGDE